MIKIISRDVGNPNKTYIKYNKLIKEELIRIRDLPADGTTLDDIKTLLLVLIDTVSDEEIINI